MFAIGQRVIVIGHHGTVLECEARDYRVESTSWDIPRWFTQDELISADIQSELAALKGENERLRAALDSVYRKANSMADYYPEPGTERNAYVSDAPEVFNDIRDTALKALQPK